MCAFDRYEAESEDELSGEEIAASHGHVSSLNHPSARTRTNITQQKPKGDSGKETAKKRHGNLPQTSLQFTTFYGTQAVLARVLGWWERCPPPPRPWVRPLRQKDSPRGGQELTFSESSCLCATPFSER